jgi:hypothetical protein
MLWLWLWLGLLLLLLLRPLGLRTHNLVLDVILNVNIIWPSWLTETQISRKLRQYPRDLSSVTGTPTK